jgi:hypothetical protein
MWMRDTSQFHAMYSTREDLKKGGKKGRQRIKHFWPEPESSTLSFFLRQHSFRRRNNAAGRFTITPITEMMASSDRAMFSR